MFKILETDPKFYLKGWFSNNLVGELPLMVFEMFEGTIPPGVYIITQRKAAMKGDFWGVGPLLLVSEKLKNFLELKNQNIKFTKIKIVHEESKLETLSFIIQVPDEFDCVDFKKSRFERSKSTKAIIAIEKLVLDKTKQEKAPDIFLLSRIDKIILLIRDEIASEMRNLGFKVKLVDVENFWR